MAQTIQTQQFVSFKKSRDLTLFILDKAQLPAAGKVWQHLEKEVANVSLTTTWDWVETWLKHFDSLVDYWFVVGMQQNKPCGIALVTKETHRRLPFPVNAYHIGTGGEPFQDRVRMTGNTILATESTKKRFVSAMIKTLMEEFSPEELVFDDYAKHEAEMISKILKKNSYNTNLEEEPALYLDLEKLRNENADVISAFGSNMRRSVRRSLKVFDDVETEWAETTEQAHSILDELIAYYQKTQRNLGRNSMFTSPHFAGFQREIIERLIERKKVILFRVKSRKYGTIGCLYMFVDNNIAYSYQIGHNEFEDATFEGISSNRLKTSYIIHALCMQECLNRGYKAYNFLLGIYRFKTEMSNAQTSTVSISVKRSIKPLLRDNIMSLYAKLDEQRNSPTALRYLRRLITR